MKYIVILITALFLGTSMKTTEKSPIMPRKANNGEYSKAEAEKIALGDSQVETWFRTNLLMLVNRGLAASGENITVNNSNIHWIFEHITYDFKDLGPYTNSRLSDGTPEWFQDKDGWSGNVAVFRYGNCTIILYKTQCLNLLDIPIKTTTRNPPPTTVVHKQDTVYIQTVATAQPISITITNTNTNTNTVGTPATTTGGRTRYVVEDDYDDGYVRQISRPVGWTSQPVIMPRQNVFHLGLQIRGGRQQRQQVIHQQPQTPRGYMGGPRGDGGNGGYMGGGSGNGTISPNGNWGGGRGN
jgi:hypothetical protein